MPRQVARTEASDEAVAERNDCDDDVDDDVDQVVDDRTDRARAVAKSASDDARTCLDRYLEFWLLLVTLVAALVAMNVRWSGAGWLAPREFSAQPMRRDGCACRVRRAASGAASSRSSRTTPTRTGRSCVDRTIRWDRCCGSTLRDTKPIAERRSRLR